LARSHKTLWNAQQKKINQDAQLKIARTLIADGADIHALNRDLETPLHVAAIHRQVGLAQLLLEAGANPNARDAWGDTPFHVFNRRHQFYISEQAAPDIFTVGPGKEKDWVTPLAETLYRHGADFALLGSENQPAFNAYRGVPGVKRVLELALLSQNTPEARRAPKMGRL
jgi:hypothetical protein